IDEVRIYPFAQNASQIVADSGRAIAGVDVSAPTAPSVLVATRVSNHQAQLAWTGSTDAVGVSFYRIRRNGVSVGTSSTTSFLDSGLASGSAYTYLVHAVDGAGNESGPSNLAVPTEAVPPTVPQNVSAIALASSKVALNWTASTDNVEVDYYRILRDGLEVGTTGSNSFLDTGLTAQTEYSYAVRAVDTSANQSSPSTAVLATTPVVDSQPPSIPLGLTAIAVSSSKISLSWSASTDNAGVDHYRVFRNGVEAGIGVATSFIDEGLEDATEYGYTVSAVDTSDHESNPSIIARATTLAGPLVPSAGLALWLRADEGVVTNGTEVSQWIDQSGHDRNAVQPSLANRPAFQSAVVNGAPAVRFDGLNDFLTFNLPVNGLSGMSIFLVAANNQNLTGAHPANHAALFFNESSAWGTVFVTPFQSAVNLRFGTTQAGNTLTYARPSSVNSSFTLTTAIKSGTVDTLYVNSFPVLSQGGKLSSIAGCQDTGNVGRGYNDNTYFGGDVAEVLVYDRALTEGERQDVFVYLNNKYALLSSTPPQIVEQPDDATVIQPNAAILSALATGTPPLSYRWRREGAFIAGATSSSYAFSPTSGADSGAHFSVVVSNAQGTVTSQVATVTVLNASLANGLALWLRADEGTVLNGSTVSQWNDQSGHARNAMQNIGGSQPLLVPNATHGHPALRFDGVNDFLQFQMSLNGLNQMSIVLVAANQTDHFNPSIHPAHHATLMWSEILPWGTVFLSSFQSTVNFRFGTTQAGNDIGYTRPASSSGFTLTTIIKDTDADFLYVQGNRVVKEGPKLPTITGVQNIASIAKGLGDSYYSGDIAELLVFDRALNAIERRALETYLEQKYAMVAPAVPEIFTQPAINLAVGATYEYFVSAYGSPPPYFVLSEAPAGMTIDSVSGRISWAPTAGDVGNRIVTVLATNSAGSDSQSFALRVRLCPPDLIAYWSLDESGGLVFQDFFGVHNAACVAPICPLPETGILGGSQMFDGTSTKVSAPARLTLDFKNQDSFSLEVWMKTDFAAEVAYWGRIDTMEYSIGQDAQGRPWFFLRDNEGHAVADCIAPAVPAFNSWHHVLGVRDAAAAEVRLYVDGVLVRTRSSAGILTAGFSSPTAPLNIGWLNLFPGYHFRGLLDEAALYGRALSAAEALNHYTNGLAGVSICGDQISNIPQILVQPSDLSVIRPAAAAFHVTAIGAVPLSYQWRREGIAIVGATSSSYGFSPTTSTDHAAHFDVVVSNAFGMITSVVATLTVTAPALQAPDILGQPANASVNEPNPAMFAVTATGTPPLFYQWRRDGTNIPGATSSSFILSPTLQAMDDGSQFTVIVSNAVGSVTSLVAALTVNTPGSMPLSGLGLWLRADDGTVLGVGSAVTQWIDHSGNNHHAIQNASSSQPSLRSAALHGFPVLRFDGVDDFLTFTLPFNGLSGMSVFMVAASTLDQAGLHPASHAALFWNEEEPWGAVYLSPFQSKLSARFGTTQTDNGLVYNRPVSVGTNFTLSTAIK
ncbi:MAG TPA: LamG-like jellyroll fold domain-containing protein, partial [Verrucomicrobiae bacterium]|nr:LamG-like jellyroll fold domain-containing protein [Verrucomicrobiae bacterium]